MMAERVGQNKPVARAPAEFLALGHRWGMNRRDTPV
jgi:hypothetical protein